MKTLYLVGGPMGVGKTSVCRELNQLLPQSVFLDGDWCWYANPFQVTSETKAMVLDNICHMLSNFLRCSAYDNVIFCWVMHEQRIIDQIKGSLPLDVCNVQTRSVSLVAHEDALRSRIEGDIRTGARNRDAVERALSYLPKYQMLDSELIDTTNMTPREVAMKLACSH